MATNSETATEAAAKKASVEELWRVLEDAAARYVCGERLLTFKNGTKPRVGTDTGEWSRRFCDHALVIRAEREGWGRELRQFLRLVVKQLLMSGWNVEKLPDVSVLMPPHLWIENASREAARARAAEAWRQGVIEEHGSVAEYIKRVRPEGAR
jgi:hypothetical protein